VNVSDWLNLFLLASFGVWPTKSCDCCCIEGANREENKFVPTNCSKICIVEFDGGDKNGAVEAELAWTKVDEGGLDAVEEVENWPSKRPKVVGSNCAKIDYTKMNI
jgi:hypothetical protein